MGTTVEQPLLEAAKGSVDGRAVRERQSWPEHD